MFGLTKNKTQFMNANAITTIERGYLEILGWRNETKLKNMWNSISRRLSKDEANDLPPLVCLNKHEKSCVVLIVFMMMFYMTIR